MTVSVPTTNNLLLSFGLSKARVLYLISPDMTLSCIMLRSWKAGSPKGLTTVPWVGRGDSLSALSSYPFPRSEPGKQGMSARHSFLGWIYSNSLLLGFV